jgi:hypothetical protein
VSDHGTADTASSDPIPKPGINWIYWLGAAAAIAIVVTAAAAIRWAGSDERQDQPVAQQWNDAIKRLGFEPVYPPVEDLAVGDVFAMITEDAVADTIAGEPFAGRSLKLMHLDLTAEIEENYRQTYQFPATTARPEHAAQVWPQQESTESLFKSPATRTALPLVLFPRFTITRSKRADGAGAVSRWWQGAFGAAAGSTESIDVRISATETYGIPAVPAEARLLDFCENESTGNFCSDEGLRRQLSIVVGSKINDMIKDPKTGKELLRFSVEVALVSRVFLARSIQTSFSADSGTAAGVSLTQPRSPGSAEQPPAAEAAEAKPAAPAAQSLEERRLAALKAQGNSTGASAAFQRESSSGVLLPDTVLARPVVVGFKSVRWKP